MKSNARIIGAVLVGVSTWLLASHFRNTTQHHKRVTKKIAKQAIHDWEGEGGNILDPAPRPAAS